MVSRINELCSFADDTEAAHLISGLRWFGIFGHEHVKPRENNLLDTLCAQLETLMSYKPGQRDLVMLQHKFFVEWENGKTVSVT